MSEVAFAERKLSLPLHMRVAIGSGFGKFGGPDRLRGEPAHQVLTPDLLTTLRARREMLKELVKRDPQAVFDMLEFHGNLTLQEAIELARQEKKLIVPNAVHGEILTNTWFQYPSVRTGTMVIYEAPDKPFGELVVFDGLTFSVPPQFQGKLNCALSVEHPDFELVNGVLRVPNEGRIHLVPLLPSKDWRRPRLRSDSGYVGLSVRGDDYYNHRQDVCASYRTPCRLGVALF